MALNALSEKLTENHLKLVDITACETQVVSGTKYILSLLVENT